MRILYPFSAIVGQEEMLTALLLTSIDPGIGGVLIRGHKGTAKSTAARALAALLPQITRMKGCPFNCPPDNPEEMHEECLKRFQQKKSLPVITSSVMFIELPLGATEDRLAGTLHIEHALKTGERRFDPGILASANRGILYIDEVNLLSDHLVDMILDAASSGQNIVEREGISLVHPSRFMLIGTMNPEEGELRPQLLDRFGLSVMVKGIDDKEARIEIAKRRIAFENSPKSFVKTWAPREQFLKQHIIEARERLKAITILDDVWDIAARLCLKANVRGHRADITLIKTATALAALMEKDEVTPSDVKEVAHFVLPHRMESVYLETPEKVHKKIDDLFKSLLADNVNSIKTIIQEDGEIDMEKIQVPGPGAVGAIFFSFLKKKFRKKPLSPNT